MKETWSLTGVIFHQDGLLIRVVSSGWSFVRAVLMLRVVASGWSFVKAVLMHHVFDSTTLQTRALPEFSFYFKDGLGGRGLICCFLRLFYDHYSFSFVSNCTAAIQLSRITNSLRAQQGALLLSPQRPCEVTISLVNQSLQHPAPLPG